VDAAIVALSIVMSDQVNTWTLIEESLHKPIDQALVVCNRGKNRDGGHAFARFVNSEAGRAIMRRYGFWLPGETIVSSR
jgi:molybdate transport system substrate-binding protein